MSFISHVPHTVGGDASNEFLIPINETLVLCLKKTRFQTRNSPENGHHFIIDAKAYVIDQLFDAVKDGFKLTESRFVSVKTPPQVEAPFREVIEHILIGAFRIDQFRVPA